MASAWARTRARERIVALGEAGLDDRDLRRQILTVLGEVIAFDFFAWLLTDPVTAVGAAPLAEAPRMSELPALIKAKYVTPVNRWTILLRQAPPVGLLSEATGGELARSLVWREMMSRYGVSDVASAVFADQYGCWGFSTCGATAPAARSRPPTRISSPLSQHRWPARCAGARRERSSSRRRHTGTTPGQSC
jgi:hypothetical protein